jgi:transcriptional regulator with XRE-family HTH domain
MEDITPRTAAAPEHPIAIARNTIGLSREGLAFKAGVSFKTIERIERGEVVPRRATLKVIADVLGVAPDALAPDEPTGAAA